MNLFSIRLLAFFLAGVLLCVATAAQAEEESLGGKIKKIFSTPTPTPHKKHKVSPSPSPSPKKKASPKASPAAKHSPSPTESGKKATPKPSASPKETPSPSPAETPETAPHHRKTSEAKRSPSPGAKHHHSPTPSEGESSSSPDEAEAPGARKRSPAPSATPSPTETPNPSASVSKGNGTHAAVATISSSEIVGYEKYPAEVRQLLDRALQLTTQNLDYKYGSADPASGGMDCSGFIYYVLSQSGMKEVPRDAREQYIWVRKAGAFQAVLGHQDDTFELSELKPGDLLFWTGTYHTDRDPAISHVMIYLGREKGTNQRVMAGSSDGRTYKGQSRYGVSVFDFKVAGRKKTPSPSESGDSLTPTFVGYGRVPGLKASEDSGE